MVEKQQAYNQPQVSTGKPGGSADGSGWVHTEVGDQWISHWSQTFVCTNPELGADPPGVYLCYLWLVVGLLFFHRYFSHKFVIKLLRA